MTRQLRPTSLCARKLTYEEFLDWDGGRDKEYAAIPIDAEGIYHCSVIKPLWIRVAWLWQKPLPGELTIYKEWGLIRG